MAAASALLALRNASFVPQRASAYFRIQSFMGDNSEQQISTTTSASVQVASRSQGDAGSSGAVARPRCCASDRLAPAREELLVSSDEETWTCHW